MTLLYRSGRVDEADRHFDAAVGCIRAGKLQGTPPPEATIFPECNLRALSRVDGIISEIGESEALPA